MRDSLTQEIVPKASPHGDPGCGKSLAIKAIASAFELPLYRIDMVEIFSGRHGKPEGAFVEACRLLEDMAPAVLWFDEIESGLSTTESGGEQGRIFAFFLTGCRRRPRTVRRRHRQPNRPPPREMIRKGRFDEVFLSTAARRRTNRDFQNSPHAPGVDVSPFDLTKLTQFTGGWAGAEIEQCVVSALTKARLAARPVSEEDLIRVP